MNMIHRRNIMRQHIRETAGLLVLAAGWAAPHRRAAFS
jgi:hypothetical protein